MRKESVHQQGHNSKKLVIYCISTESEFLGMEIIQSMFRSKEKQSK